MFNFFSLDKQKIKHISLTLGLVLFSLKLQAGVVDKNILYWQSFLEFNLADSSPDIYLQTTNSRETLALLEKEKSLKQFSYYPLAMSSEFIYLNSKGNVYRVLVFDPSDLEKMKTGNRKSLNLTWKDPDTQHVFSMNASLKMVDPSNENYDSSFKMLSTRPRKTVEEVRLEKADLSNASELVSLKLMGLVEDLSQSLKDESRKKLYDHKVTQKSFLLAVERSKKIFENDSFMLKFLEKVSSGLTSLE